MVITAPGLFSMMTRQPSLSDSSAAMTRQMMSGGVLGAVGTTIRMMLDGNGCAVASEGKLGILTEPATNPAHIRCVSNRKIRMDVLLGMTDVHSLLVLPLSAHAISKERKKGVHFAVRNGTFHGAE
jgi:hypothetical protein